VNTDACFMQVLNMKFGGELDGKNGFHGQKMVTRPRPYIRMSVHNWRIWGPRLSVVCINPLTHIQSSEQKSILPCQSGMVIPRQTSTVKYLKI